MFSIGGYRTKLHLDTTASSQLPQSIISTDLQGAKAILNRVRERAFVYLAPRRGAVLHNQTITVEDVHGLSGDFIVRTGNRILQSPDNFSRVLALVQHL